MTTQLQDLTGLSTRTLCARLGLPATSLRRWRRRSARGEPLLNRPGPKKTGPLPFGDVEREVEALLHGRKRSRGTGELYAQHREAVSRRELSRCVAAQRQSLLADQRRSFRRVRWHHPNLAWAIDATEYGADQSGRKLFLLVTVDLASRYVFAPLVTLAPDGAQVVAYLRELFLRHGRPLLLKRDNGSIFNHHEVDALLAAEAVIPLNSPAYYPRYNGGVEKGIRDLKSSLARCLPHPPEHWQPAAITDFTQAAAHLRNCTPRRSLRQLTAAQTYHDQPRLRFTKPERHAAFLWIKRHSVDMLASIHQPARHHHAAAWRLATQLWLERHHLITITINQPCVTPF